MDLLLVLLLILLVFGGFHFGRAFLTLVLNARNAGTYSVASKDLIQSHWGTALVGLRLGLHRPKTIRLFLRQRVLPD